MPSPLATHPSPSPLPHFLSLTPHAHAHYMPPSSSPLSPHLQGHFSTFKLTLVRPSPSPLTAPSTGCLLIGMAQCTPIFIHPIPDLTLHSHHSPLLSLLRTTPHPSSLPTSAFNLTLPHPHPTSPRTCRLRGMTQANRFIATVDSLRLDCYIRVQRDCLLLQKLVLVSTYSLATAPFVT